MVVSLYQEPTTDPKIDLATPFWHNAHLVNAGSIRRIGTTMGGEHATVLALAGYIHVCDMVALGHTPAERCYHKTFQIAGFASSQQYFVESLASYGNFVYRVALRAVAVRCRLHFLSPAERICLFCTNSVKSYAHLLVECRYTVAIWKSFAPLCRWLEMLLPRTLVGFLYDEPAARTSKYKSTIAVLWPILRASVWYTLWLERNDRVFRASLSPTTAESLAIKAAILVRIHLLHVVRRSEDPHLTPSLRRLLHDPWCARYVVPHTITPMPPADS
ncbi:hypothetical protein ACHHYP_20677 [Achlya hypogyna]|uniref:Reverse transcriptase zinc-binding domain-containing protein n=1 Tax=Achlya hypogyna TaxID=1202772 RepID=A0A1V9YF89_ACHHY|nr:hypothetical protein ACHHYP_20677 [Achlya hypogyna]